MMGNFDMLRYGLVCCENECQGSMPQELVCHFETPDFNVFYVINQCKIKWKKKKVYFLTCFYK